MIKPATVRIILTLAVSYNWLITQLDVSNAFLNCEIQETVYMPQSPGFVDKHFPTHVCKLRKSLYDLKQSPRVWNDKLKQTLFANGFSLSKSETTHCSLVSQAAL